MRSDRGSPLLEGGDVRCCWIVLGESVPPPGSLGRSLVAPFCAARLTSLLTSLTSLASAGSSAALDFLGRPALLDPLLVCPERTEEGDCGRRCPSCRRRSVLVTGGAPIIGQDESSVRSNSNVQIHQPLSEGLRALRLYALCAERLVNLRFESDNDSMRSFCLTTKDSPAKQTNIGTLCAARCALLSPLLVGRCK